MDQYQEYIAASRYARYLDDKGRREQWSETVWRYVDYIFSRTQEITNNVELKDRIYKAIYNLEVMPSMRAVMTAGKSADRDNTCVYNCSYLPVDDPKSFDEAMFILLCGTGVGFSVEGRYVSQLPEVPEKLFDSDHVIAVHDSKEGWAKALRLLIAHLYAGEIPKWDVSKVRPAGARLKTFGGRASGPEPLVDLFSFTVNTFKNAKGRRLNSLECHDLMCKIGEVVVVGGVRRSAMISLSDLDDERIRHAKSGPWWETAPHRALANNSAVYNETPTGVSTVTLGDVLASTTTGLTLKTSGVTAASYGSASTVPSITVDTKGRITAASNTAIAVTASQVSDFTEAVQDVVGSNLVSSSDDIAATYDDENGGLTLSLKPEAITSKTEVSPAGADHILVSDASDSGALKKVTVQALSELSGAAFTANWTTGTSLQVTHNLNSRDLIIQIYALDDYEDILVSSIKRTTVNTIDLVANQAPTGSGWRILIKRI